MNPPEVLLLAFLIGAASGLRSLTAPAAVAWAAHLGWLNLNGTPLSFMGSTAAAAVFTVLALAELVADKLPSTPSRTKPPGLIARIVLGGLSGASVSAAGMQSIGLGASLGIAGGLSGAFAGYQVRTRLVRALKAQRVRRAPPTGPETVSRRTPFCTSSLKVPDIVIALLEDAAAIGGSFFLVSRF